MKAKQPGGEVQCLVGTGHSPPHKRCCLEPLMKVHTRKRIQQNTRHS